MDVDGSLIIRTAGYEIGTSVKTARARVISYIERSGAFVTAIPEKRSWCGDFAYWVLALVRLSPLPALWRFNNGNSNAISRFFARFPKTTDPLPGDMYYRPFIEVNGVRKDVEHVGFVTDPTFGPDRILTINGNASGLNADWSLGMGGGCVSMGTAPLTGPTKVHTFLAIAARPVELEGRWEVQIGVWTWHYIFKPGRTRPTMGEVLCTDIRDVTRVRFIGTWWNEDNRLAISWAKTNSDEVWTVPLVPTNQKGRSPNKHYSVTATKIEGKDITMKTRFTFDLD